MTEIDLSHKEMTDEEIFQLLKKYKHKPDLMDAKLWKKLRLKQLKKEGKKWSK